MSKLVFLSLMAIITFSINATEVIFQGDLVDDLDFKGRIEKKIVLNGIDEIKLVNEYFEVQSCQDGKFVVEQAGHGKYELTSVVECKNWLDETALIESCPENFQPVCGEVEGIAGSLNITFTNSCELYRSKAVFVANGTCRN